MMGADRQVTLACAIAGLLLCAIALVIGGGMRAGLLGWLAASAFVAGLPLGALCLALVVRIVPGAWRHATAPGTDVLASAVPLVVILSLPVVAGLWRIYPWATDGALSGFKVAYLTPAFFTARTIAILAGAAVLATFILNQSAGPSPLAVGGLIAFVLLHGLLAVDWLLSLDPRFHSSGFGLYVLAGHVLSAFCVVTMLRISKREDHSVQVLGPLLLTLLLLWAYFAFMQYFIIWSGNLPAGVTWYRMRGEGHWVQVEYLIAISRLLPAFLLLFSPIRHGRRWLPALATTVLCGSVLESAWLVLPAGGSIGALPILSFVFALIGMLLLLPVGRLAGLALSGVLYRGRPAP